MKRVGEETTERSDDRLVAAVNRVFHDVAAEYYDHSHGSILVDEVKRWQGIAKRIGRLLDGNSLRLLDLGAGTGFVPNSVLPHLPRVQQIIAVDISQEMLKRTADKLHGLGIRPQVSTVACDASKQPLASGSISIVTANSVLHHVPDPNACMREVRRILEPGGIFALAHEPNRRAPRNPVLLGLHLVHRVSSKLARTALHILGAGNKGTRKPKIHTEVIRRLRAEGIIAKDSQVDAKWVASVVDVHSPTAGQGLLREGGFDPYALVAQHFAGWECILLETYSHLGTLRPVNPLVRTGNALLKRLFPRCGWSFALVVRKPST